MAFLKAQELSNKTVNKIIAVLKQVMAFAESERYINRNSLIRYPSLKQPPGRIDFLSKQEALQLLRSNVFEFTYPLLLVALNTGMRIGEITALCWDRLNFETDTIEVSRTLGQHGLQQTTKSNRVRYIPMNHEVKTVLLKLFREQKNAQFVFADISGKPFNPDHFSQRHFTKALRAANIRHVTFHVLRHTYASLFMMNGGNIYDLQKVLGHSNVRMTMIYAHLSPQHMREAMDVVRLSSEGEGINSPYCAPNILPAAAAGTRVVYKCLE